MGFPASLETAIHVFVLGRLHRHDFPQALVFLPVEPIDDGTHKHSSVIKVLQISSYPGVKKWKGAALSSPSLKGKGSSCADLINLATVTYPLSLRSAGAPGSNLLSMFLEMVPCGPLYPGPYIAIPPLGSKCR